MPLTDTEISNEAVIRALYEAAEVNDVDRFVSLFTSDGYFWDVSAGTKYCGAEIGKTVEVYATAFPDMHRFIATPPRRCFSGNWACLPISARLSLTSERQDGSGPSSTA
jgi:hypothetical protein